MGFGTKKMKSENINDAVFSLMVKTPTGMPCPTLSCLVGVSAPSLNSSFLTVWPWEAAVTAQVTGSCHPRGRQGLGSWLLTSKE